MNGVVVIGGSAGAMPAVEAIVRSLPSHPARPVVVVLHRGRGVGRSPGLATRLTTLSLDTVKEVEDLDLFVPGVVHLAPPGYHTLIGRHGPVLSSEPRQSYSLPSIDAAFESAADAFGAAAVGVTLSCANADGVEGARAILAAGGRVFTVDPAEAQFAILAAGVAALEGAQRVLESDVASVVASLVDE